MKALATFLISTVPAFLISAFPATASIPEDIGQSEILPQTVSMTEDVSSDAANCGRPEEMIIIVRDEQGAVVAIGKAHVAVAC